jgi:di/tricarboxylate transporter
MTTELTIVLLLLAAAIAMFAINKPRMDAVALMMLTALPFTGVLTMGEALAGFSEPNIVLIAALFVIGEGLVRIGVARRLGDWLAAKATVNTLVATPGNYTFGDFVCVCVPFSLIVLAVSVILVPWLLPL